MKRDSNSRDDILANLVDRILAEKEQATDAPVVGEKRHDLEGTVRLLQKHIETDPPNQEMVRRVQTRLTSEWRRSGPGERANLQAKKKTQQIVMLSFATVAAMAIISTIILVPDVYKDLQGTATETSPIWALVGLIILILGLITWIIIHHSRRRKK